MPEIKEFLSDRNELKRLMELTKSTDSFYLGKRNISAQYDPLGAYDFASWRELLDDPIKYKYEHLHETLLYTNKKQNFEDALSTLEKLDHIFAQVGE